jgi:hypothetical protein
MSKIPLDSASKMVKIGIYTINWGGGQLLRMGEYIKDTIKSTYIYIYMLPPPLSANRFD